MNNHVSERGTQQQNIVEDIERGGRIARGPEGNARYAPWRNNCSCNNG
jgi:hypothetical protein